MGYVRILRKNHIFRDLLPPHQKSWDKVKLLMSFWRLPSIFVDDIEECICEKQDKTVVKRDFIIKLVPRQIVDRCDKITRQHFQHKIKKLNIENKVTIKLITSTRPWFETHRAPTYQAARKAIIQVRNCILVTHSYSIPSRITDFIIQFLLNVSPYSQ